MNYLYNGIELPALPEWDTTKYPHAIIFWYGGLIQTYVLYLIPQITYATSGSEEWCIGYSAGSCSYAAYDNAWTSFIEHPEANSLLTNVNSITWTNTDLLNEDSSVFLAASEPTKFVEFNVTNALGTGGRIIACYEDVYDPDTNSTTLAITAIKAQVTNSGYEHLYYPDGELWLTDQNGNPIPLTNVSGNEKAVLTFKSSTPTAHLNIGAANTWYDVVIPTSNSTFTTTTYTPIVHDHEGSEIVNISLGLRTDSGNPRFAFYTDDKTDPGYSWGTIDSQTITLTVGEPEEPEEPLVIPDHAYGKQQYLFNGVKLPKLPSWDKTTYPHFFIRYHEIDGNGYFSLIATDAAGVVENKTLTFKNLVAYLYNGVQLPPLPEWDKEKYPYAYIVQNTDGSDYYLILYTAEHKVSASGLAGALSNRRYRVTDGEWKLIDGGSLVVGTVIWANNTVYYTESTEGIGGTVYLQATDPIPVYE